MEIVEEKVSASIVQRYFDKLQNHLAVDVAIVGCGPAGMVAAASLAKVGKKVAIYERKLASGGGTWGGGMLFNELVVQDDALEILDDFGIRHTDAGGGYHTADSVEVASGLTFGALQAGVTIFNATTVQDIVFKNDKVCGVVINWSPVEKLDLHVDPIVITAQAVLDGTGHPAEVTELACKKAGVSIDTPTGDVMGEKPMWMESGEATTVENTKRLYPGLYVAGMAANNVSGGFRMGPIFGGMFLSGRKIAEVILADID